jgi:3-methyladenine DNA glycosylase AlkD
VSAKDLAGAVRSALRRVADPTKAAPMQAYAKSSMPYLGVTVPKLRAVCREVFAEIDFPTAAAWRRATLGIWRSAGFREERYCAIELTGVRRFDRFQDMAALPMYEEMIATGAWWDYVDGIAGHRLGPLLRRFPREMKKEMLAWSRSGDLWKHRSAILCQLTFKKDTDLDLLYATIEPALAAREFFLRKAIGWALRQYAWTDPKEVRRYVRAHEGRLSGLSKREALKNVGAKDRGPARRTGAARSSWRPTSRRPAGS